MDPVSDQEKSSLIADSLEIDNRLITDQYQLMRQDVISPTES